MYKKIIIIALVFSSIYTYGQTDIDALRYSRNTVIGSARAMGVGGALGALGGDFATLSVNPAGIATYRQSRIMFSPSLNFNRTETRFGENNSDNISNKIQFSNLGIVFSRASENKKWKTLNFALGANRLANYGQRFNFSGTTRGSITEKWVENANGLTPSELSAFEEGLAYDTNILFNPQGSNETEYAADMDANTTVFKQQSFRSTGTLNEMVISLGGNYNHKLYVGATIGVPLVRYNETKNYDEIDDNDEIDFFNSLRFTESLGANGIGVNAKFGIIYRLNQTFRVGLAAHTPTLLSITENYFTTVTSNLTFNGVSEEYSADSPNGNFEYTLFTPSKIIISGAMLVKKQGFITAEVEVVDYGSAYFNLNTDQNPGEEQYENEVNNNISSKYTQAINARLGAELAFEIFRIRAGYALYSSPFQPDLAFEPSIQQKVSLGFGIHEQYYYIDLAYVKSTQSEEYLPYFAPNSPNINNVINTTNNTQFVITLGYKF